MIPQVSDRRRLRRWANQGTEGVRRLEGLITGNRQQNPMRSSLDDDADAAKCAELDKHQTANRAAGSHCDFPLAFMCSWGYHNND